VLVLLKSRLESVVKLEHLGGERASDMINSGAVTHHSWT
jgi:glutaminase